MRRESGENSENYFRFPPQASRFPGFFAAGPQISEVLAAQGFRAKIG